MQEHKAFKRAHPELFSDNDDASTKSQRSTTPKSTAKTPVLPVPAPAAVLRKPFTYVGLDGRKVEIIPEDPIPPDHDGAHEGPPPRAVSNYWLIETPLHPGLAKDSSIELKPLKEALGSRSTEMARSKVPRPKTREYSPGVVGDLERQQLPAVREEEPRNLAPQPSHAQRSRPLANDSDPLRDFDSAGQYAIDNMPPGRDLTSRGNSTRGPRCTMVISQSQS